MGFKKVQILTFFYRAFRLRKTVWGVATPFRTGYRQNGIIPVTGMQDQLRADHQILGGCFN